MNTQTFEETEAPTRKLPRVESVNYSALRELCRDVIEAHDRGLPLGQLLANMEELLNAS